MLLKFYQWSEFVFVRGLNDRITSKPFLESTMDLMSKQTLENVYEHGLLML